MASLTARRGLGARVALFVAIMAVGLAPMPGSANAPATLTSASFINQWASPTVLVADDPGGRAFDEDDAPYKWADGTIDYLLTRWDRQVCDGSRTGDIPPVFTVTERDDPDAAGDGLAVVGNVTVEAFRSGAPFPITQPGRLVRFTVNDPAYPHGLAAGRDINGTNTINGGGAPFTIHIEVYHRNQNGVCATSAGPTVYDTVIGIDRELPPVPRITAPARLVNVNRGGEGGSNNTTFRDACEEAFGPQACGGIDPVSIALPQDGTVEVTGVATDPRTKPDAEDGNDYGFLETSGVAAVVVRLYSADSLGTDPLGACFGICPGAFAKSYTATNPDCGETHILNTAIPRCSESFNFTVDVTADLIPGNWYAIDAYTLDLSGNRSAVASDQPNNADNTQGPEAKTISFLYLG